MRVVFMGTPEFAVPSLQTLLDYGCEVVAVYTQSDKPKGRGHKLTPPPVKERALQYEIPVFQPTTLRTEEAAAELRRLAPDLIVVAAYGKLLPPAVLEIPRYGCINVHASLLPKYRGAGPIQWAVIHGEPTVGVTTMQMGEGLDTGDMLLCDEVEIGETETAGELYDRLAELGGQTLKRTLIALESGALSPIPQDDAKATYAPMLTKELSAIDFSRPAEELHHLILGLSPWPCAEAVLQGARLKIYRSELVSKEDIAGKPGEILVGKDFCVACQPGVLRLTEVQGEGSRRMSGADFLRGHRPEPGSILLRKER